METKHIIGFLVGIIVIVGGIAFIASKQPVTGPASDYNLVAFAQCLRDKGATFYGAFWCPHCQATKKIFGPEATKVLPYVECSTPDGRGQLPICIDKKVESYPTWEFADGTRLGGELSPDMTPTPGFITLAQLAEKTNCPLIKTDGTQVELPTSTVGTTTNATASSTTSSVVSTSTATSTKTTR
jgi:hypothetical protein